MDRAGLTPPLILRRQEDEESRGVQPTPQNYSVGQAPPGIRFDGGMVTQA